MQFPKAGQVQKEKTTGDLYVGGEIGVGGRGIIANSSGEWIMEPGDVAIIPAGHPNPHGVTADNAIVHRAISTPGDQITIGDTEPRGPGTPVARMGDPVCHTLRNRGDRLCG